jgi:hypothetical protein
MSIPELPPVSGESRAKSPDLTIQAVDLTYYTHDDLVDLRSRIDELMPVRRLKDLNLETELVIQLQSVQRLQNSVINDNNTPANQKAQTAGQVASALATLSKLQSEVYSSERMKMIEAILIEAVKDLPLASQQAFMTRYEDALGKIDG